MAKPQPQIDGLAGIFDAHLEWLIVRENGRTLPMLCSEIEVESANGKTTIGFVDEKGLSVWRVENFEIEEAEVIAKVSSRIRNVAEEIRFVPRESAAELRANIELARLEKANEIAWIFVAGLPETKIVRISLNVQNGRIAQIETGDRSKQRSGVMADVTASLTHESLLASALKWQDELRQRKKNPIRNVSIVAEKRQARALQKLQALLNKGASESISIFEIDRRLAVPVAKELRHLKISDLWRERAVKMRLPELIEPSETAER